MMIEYVEKNQPPKHNWANLELNGAEDLGGLSNQFATPHRKGDQYLEVYCRGGASIVVKQANIHETKIDGESIGWCGRSFIFGGPEDKIKGIVEELAESGLELEERTRR